MVLHWERHRDLDVLANGLNSHRRLTWGPVEQCTPTMLNNFVSGMRELPPELVRKVDLLFPEEPSLLEKTRAFRSALATVPALVEPIYASREQLAQWGLGLGLGEVRRVSREYQQVLYPTTTLERRIENSDYGHRMELARLQVGEQPNWDWWIRRSWLEKDDAQEFIVATEEGILHEMKKRAPHKKLMPALVFDESCNCSECFYMKRNTLEKLYLCMKYELPEITMDEELRLKALKPIEAMLELSTTVK